MKKREGTFPINGVCSVCGQRGTLRRHGLYSALIPDVNNLQKFLCDECIFFYEKAIFLAEKQYFEIVYHNCGKLRIHKILFIV